MNTFRIIGLTILTLLSISPIVMASSPHKPVSTTQSFSQPVPLQVFDPTVVTPRGAFVWNFTVDFTGKDAGSDTFTLVTDYDGAALVLLMSEKNLTDWLSSSPSIHIGQELAISAFTLPQGISTPGCGGYCTSHTVTLNFRPPASGSYHLVFVPTGTVYGTVSVQTLHIEVHGLQTWTTTTIA